MNTIERVAGVARLAIASLTGVGFIALAAVTLIPGQASRPNRLGYYSVCSYAPISTTILLAVSAALIYASYRNYTRLKNQTPQSHATRRETTPWAT